VKRYSKILRRLNGGESLLRKRYLPNFLDKKSQVSAYIRPKNTVENLLACKIFLLVFNFLNFKCLELIFQLWPRCNVLR
jgi:hypothetical protein